MDVQKGGQALKAGLDMYGTNIMKDNRRFSSLIDDMLCGPDYAVERMILKRAAESYILSYLFELSEITADTAGRAVEQLIRESRMIQEDAEFTVQCVIIARGGNLEIVTENTNNKINVSVNYENTEVENDRIQINTDIIFRACKISMDSLFCELGYPLGPSSKRFLMAKNNFKIPDNDDIYFILDATASCSCKNGFAICTSGIYSSSMSNGYISWAEFKRLGFYIQNSNIVAIGDKKFTVNSVHAEIIGEILKNIRNELKSC